MMENQSELKKVRIRLMLLTLLFLGLLFYFFQFNPSKNEGAFLRCPSNLIFGINCPGCGSQRALHHLLHLEILEALKFNALFTIAFPLAILYFVLKLFGYKKTIPFTLNKYLIIGLFILVILYGVLRNIPIYPFTFLAP